MNYIWTVIMVVSLCACLFSDPIGALNTALASCADALGLTVNLCAVYAWWLGVFSILEQSGVVDVFAKALSRPIKYLFGQVSQRTVKLVCLSISANILGVSNAATPYGIEACAEMAQNECAQMNAGNTTQSASRAQGTTDSQSRGLSAQTKRGGKMSRPIAMLFVLNATSLQILPTTVVGMRSAVGSVSPSDIVLPTLIVSVVTTVIGALLIHLLYKKDCIDS